MKPEKTLPIIMDELKKRVETAIAESGLPSCVLEPLFCAYWLQLKGTSDACLEADRKRYENDEKTEAGKEAELV